MSGPYCGHRVKVIGTSKDDLNGTEGVATSFDAGSGRYHVSFPGNKVLALRPVNLESLGAADTSSSSTFGSMPGMGANSPQMQEAQRQAQEILNQLQTMLPPGITIQQALGGVAVFVIFFIYRLGFLFGIPSSLFILGSVVIAFPSFKNAGGGMEGVKAGVSTLSQRLSAQVAQQTGWPVTEKHATIAIAMLFGWTAFLLVSPLLMSSRSAHAAREEVFAAPNTFQGSAIGLFEAYEQGYEAGKGGEAYENPFTKGEGAHRASDDIYSNVDVDVSSARSSRSSFFSLDKILPLILVGKAVYDMGGRPWNQQTFINNFQAADWWKKALMGLAVMRMLT
mmetsp:Transcript_15735/g.17764  ORF Transcript_15735/g.17764 Transcript_15735/m.17764 type:complete len:337 (+) Transcript_15735:212-1222(+)|eukprot:CAMPEP_0184017740 /NCGR_PEP_ID=MMETSP0954-20121128/7724_1 /TAXON_ID=627963 /ORGANISM="Aplanochytrium sp, Strain PBS07" /LENGTH=336 /DNA_ID=CAMNT_0026299049 /DNA_START=327 /DNA_END=1337 /DNA_ORIENTATION=+